jgi:hypothetical protein
LTLVTGRKLVGLYNFFINNFSTEYVNNLMAVKNRQENGVHQILIFLVQKYYSRFIRYFEKFPGIITLSKREGEGRRQI